MFTCVFIGLGPASLRAATPFILTHAQVFGWLGLMTDNEEVGSGVKVGARRCQRGGEGFRLRTKASNLDPDTFTPVGALFPNQMCSAIELEAYKHITRSGFRAVWLLIFQTGESSFTVFGPGYMSRV